MIKSKAIIISTACLLVSLLLGIAGLTFAWYTNRAGADSGLVLDADGYLVVYFDEEPNQAPSSLKPAIAAPNAVRDGVKFAPTSPGDADYADVTNAANEYIVEAAQVAEFSVTFHYINADASDQEPRNVSLDIDAEMIDGETARAMSLTRDLALFACARLDDVVPASSEYTPIIDGNEISFNGINQNVNITVYIRAYLRLPNELADPILRSPDCVVRVRLAASAQKATSGS